VIDLTEYTLARRKYLRSIQVYCVYVICPDGLKPCRVGSTVDVVDAQVQLQRGCWFKLHISFVLWTPGKVIARRIESACHTSMEAFRLDGDWFDVHCDDVAEMGEHWAKSLYPSASYMTHADMKEMFKRKLQKRPDLVELDNFHKK
jgi:Meiotically up-regulated gene 113